MYQIYSGQNGKIVHLDYQNNEKIEWHINADCVEVSIVSTQFDTEVNFDYVTIDNVPYSGRQWYMGTTVVTEIVQSPLVVSFSSDGSITDEGFVLEWECIPGKEQSCVTFM